MALALHDLPIGLYFSVSIYGVGVALSAALFVAVSRHLNRKSGLDATSLAVYALPLAFVFARLFFCLARFDFVFIEMGVLFALSTWEGGFLMWGALVGAALGGFLASKRHRADCLDTLDGMAAPVMASVALLRLFEYFSTEGRGLFLEEGSFFRFFPFSVPNAFSEWRLAVFFWEAIAALAILIILLRHTGRRGDKALLMLIAYGAAQIIFESLRVDSSPKWGFVRVSQVLSAIALFGAGMVRTNMLLGRRKALARGAIVLLCIAAVGILEWALDKTPLPIWVCYVLMCIAMAAALPLVCPRIRTRT